MWCGVATVGVIELGLLVCKPDIHMRNTLVINLVYIYFSLSMGMRQCNIFSRIEKVQTKYAVSVALLIYK